MDENLFRIADTIINARITAIPATAPIAMAGLLSGFVEEICLTKIPINAHIIAHAAKYRRPTIIKHMPRIVPVAKAMSVQMTLERPKPDQPIFTRSTLILAIVATAIQPR